jgi:hypothetical protein
MSSRSVGEFGHALRRLIKELATGTFDATVESVDEQTRTCEVKVGNVFYQDVALYAVKKKELKGPCMIPKKGSRVLISRIGGSNYFYVAMFSEVEKVLFTINEEQTLEATADKLEVVTGESRLRITDKGLTLMRGSAGLKKTLGDILDGIMAMTVTTGVGPSGTPINMATFQEIKQKLNDYLEE